MSDLEIWGVIAGLAAITWLIRYSFIGFLAGWVLPGWLRAALDFVPVTVLPAIAAPAIFLGPAGAAALPILVGSAATLLTGILSRSLFGAFAAGMIAYHAVQLAV